MRIKLLATGVTLALTAHAEALHGYATLQDAARAALDDAEALTDAYEAGGAIYQCGAVYAYVAPVTQRHRDRVDIAVGTADGCALAGTYHTHPRGDARYSETDIKAACAADTVSFIKPRGGSVRAFDCHGMSYAARQTALSRPTIGQEI
jgi:proteasome lid subunit RPN8/RPN11